MSSWLGVRGYSLKDTILNSVASIATSLDLSMRVAGHVSKRNTEIYMNLTGISDRLKVNSKIVVPGLHIKFGNYDEEMVFSLLKSFEI
jgi:hypothetical protein